MTAADAGAEVGLEDVVRRALGARVVRMERIEAGLGLRRFVRLVLDRPPGRVIARIEAPEDPAGRPNGLPPEPPLEPLREFLEGKGLPVPGRYGGDTARGIELLEDLGDRSLERTAKEAAPETRRRLYEGACDLVPRLQALRDPEGRIPAFRRRLDETHLAYKAELFCRWSLPLALERAPRASERQVVADAFAWIASRCADAPARLAHRDFQSRNLLVRSRDGDSEIVMIDFQGAFLAPPEYDLVCLLRDSYVELADSEVASLCERVRPRLPDAPDRQTFAHRFDLLTLARKGKDHARFLYVASTRGDARALDALPPTARALKGAARRTAQLHSSLEALAAWIAALPAGASRSCGR